METACVEDEFTLTVSKRQKLCQPLEIEKLKADSSQILKTLHDHYDMVAEKRSLEIKLKEDELQILSLKLREIQKKIEATEIEAIDKEKELDLLRNQIKSEEKTLIELRTSVKNTQNELELKKTELRRLSSSVLVKHEQQPIAAAEIELSTGDALMFLEGQIRGAHRRQKLGLQDSVVENLVLFFEELAEIGGSDKAQMQLKATQVATLWKGKIIIEAPRSSLEALAFLLFIVAYDLKSLINQEETALLATSVFHYKQGPRLFHLLGLKRKIPEFVRDLIEDHQYVPAVRIICLSKLRDFSATTLLMKEITDLRRSTLEKAENKDVGRLKAIVELVADYKLDIDLPGDLIAKLMFQRENSTPPVLHCSVEAPEETSTSSSNPKDTSFQVAATRSGVDLLFPKRETKPFVNPSAIGRF